MLASDLFVKSLENEGVHQIFGVPGEENLRLLESIRKSSIEFVVTRHEQSAGFMAATIGRLTGVPGVCLSTLGPGATNLMTPAAYAQLGGMPMLMITGQKPVKKSKQGHFQIIKTVDMMAPVTKFSKQIINASLIPSLVREAFRLAEEERPGAVHLELPEDVAEESVTAQLFPVDRVRRPIAENKAIDKAVNLIQAAKRPLLLLGAGANRKRASKMLTQFVDKTGIYFFNTQMGTGVIDERHPQFLGTAALSDNDFIHQAINQADLIINVGHDVIEKPPFIMKPKSTKVIHVNFSSAQVDDVYFPQLEVIGDIANAVWQIKQKIKPSTDWDFSLFKKVKADLDKDIQKKQLETQFPIIPQRLIATVRELMPSDGIVALDNGLYKLWFSRNYPTHEPNTLLLDNALATMGAGLPSAMAAKIVNPDKKVLAVCGDGGFLMNAQELETAHRLKLNLTILVLVDNQYGMISWKQQAMKLKDFGLKFHNPDFVKLAESYHCHGYQIDSIEQLKPTLKKTLALKGIHLIALPITYPNNFNS